MASYDISILGISQPVQVRFLGAKAPLWLACVRVTRHMLNQKSFEQVTVGKKYYKTMQLCKYACMQVCGYAGMQVYKYASMQVCKYASMQSCINASMGVCEYAST